MSKKPQPPPANDFKAELKKKLDEMKKAEPRKARPKPLPKTVKRPDPPAREKSEQELFLEAANGVDRDVVLKKYDTTPPPAPARKAPEEKKREDEALFESFVGPVDKKR
jgi:hypothetical protein